ncbi:MAG: hypothetical protein H0V73_12110 [Chloroflexi bacterium]|nr:hypothetical protein [Chloroflexota bacterium]
MTQQDPAGGRTPARGPVPTAGPATTLSVPSGSRRVPVLIAIGAALIGAALIVAVAAGSMVLGGPVRHVETGIVVAVQATSLSSVQGFSIQTTDGRTVDFRVGSIENAATFPTGHLAEHKVGLVPVRVTFIDQNGSHLAVRIEDAP